MAPNELVIPVSVGALGYATYFVSNQANEKSDPSIGVSKQMNAAAKDPVVLQNEVSISISNVY